MRCRYCDIAFLFVLLLLRMRNNMLPSAVHASTPTSSAATTTTTTAAKSYSSSAPTTAKAQNELHRKHKKRRRRRPSDSTNISTKEVEGAEPAVPVKSSTGENRTLKAIKEVGGGRASKAATSGARSPSDPRQKQRPKQPTRRQKLARQTRSQQQRKSSDRGRRLLGEWKDLIASGHAYHWERGKRLLLPNASKKTPSNKGTYFVMGPLEERNLNVWHFSMVGPADSVFERGLYHGMLVLPNDYPLKPPLSIQVWTPSGRFVCRKSICLSASQYHPEEWNPAQWSLRTLVEALRFHFLTGANEIAGRNDSYEQRLSYARQSRNYKCRLARRDGTAVVVDHNRMILDGIFDGYLLPDDDHGEENAEEEDNDRTAASVSTGRTAITPKTSSLGRIAVTSSRAGPETCPAESNPDHNPTKKKKVKRKQNKKKKGISLSEPAFGLASTAVTAARGDGTVQQGGIQQPQPFGVLSTARIRRKQIRLFVVGLVLFLFLWLNR